MMSEEKKNTDPQANQPEETQKPTPKKTASQKTSKTSGAKTSGAKTSGAKTSGAKTSDTKTARARTSATKSKTDTRKSAAKTEKTKTEEKPTPEEIMQKTSEKTSSSKRSADILDDLKERDWMYIGKRGLMMILFGFFGSIAFSIATSLTFIHFIVAILLDGPHAELQNWINKCGAYVKDVFRYLSYETDDMPFPFNSE